MEQRPEPRKRAVNKQPYEAILAMLTRDGYVVLDCPRKASRVALAAKEQGILCHHEIKPQPKVYLL